LVITDRVFADLGASVKGIPVYPGEPAIAVGGLALLFATREPQPRWRTGLGWAIGAVTNSVLLALVTWRTTPAEFGTSDLAELH
jgi:hypothetical protein